MLHSTHIYRATNKNRKLGKKKRSVPVAGLAETSKGRTIFTITNSRWDSSSPIHKTHAEYLMLEELRKSKDIDREIKFCITVQPCSKCLNEIREFNKLGGSKITDVTYLFDNSWKEGKEYLKLEKEINIKEYILKLESEKKYLYELALAFTKHQDRSKMKYNPNELELANYEKVRSATLLRLKP